MTKTILIIALSFSSLAALADTSCVAHLLNLKTNQHIQKPLVLNENGLYRADIDGFEFGADMNPGNNVAAGGGIYNKQLGIHIFTQADKDNSGTLDQFYQSSEILGYRLTLDCTSKK